MVERNLGKIEVIGSLPIVGSNWRVDREVRYRSGKAKSGQNPGGIVTRILRKYWCGAMVAQKSYILTAEGSSPFTSTKFGKYQRTLIKCRTVTGC
jgi:hypothetical protein